MFWDIHFTVSRAADTMFLTSMPQYILWSWIWIHLRDSIETTTQNTGLGLTLELLCAKCVLRSMGWWGEASSHSKKHSKRCLSISNPTYGTFSIRNRKSFQFGEEGLGRLSGEGHMWILVSFSEFTPLGRRDICEVRWWDTRNISQRSREEKPTPRGLDDHSADRTGDKNHLVMVSRADAGPQLRRCRDEMRQSRELCAGISYYCHMEFSLS